MWQTFREIRSDQIGSVHSLTHSLTHSLRSDWFTRSLTLSLTQIRSVHSLTHSLTHSDQIGSFQFSSAGSRTDLLQGEPAVKGHPVADHMHCSPREPAWPGLVDVSRTSAVRRNVGHDDEVAVAVEAVVAGAVDCHAVDRHRARLVHHVDGVSGGAHQPVGRNPVPALGGRPDRRATLPDHTRNTHQTTRTQATHRKV